MGAQASYPSRTSSESTVLASQTESSSFGNVPPQLETLPVEIQEFILAALPTVQALGCLVQASPRFHALYARNREAILRACLSRILGPVLVDAIHCQLSRTDRFQQTRTLPIIQDFLNLYDERRRTPQDSRFQEVSLKDVVDIARFQASVVGPLAEQYGVWALAFLGSRVDSPQASALSITEMGRVQRALYRLQIFCNVCGHRTTSGDSDIRIKASFSSEIPQDTNVGFLKSVEVLGRTRMLSQFCPWEVEEILCIDEFAQDQYIRVFHDVAWDLDTDRNPKFAHLPLGSQLEFLGLDLKSYSK